MDDENRKLREELLRLKGGDSSSSTTNNHTTNVYNVKKRHNISSTLSNTNGFDRELGRNMSPSAGSSTLVERLTHENAELRRDLGAQISMLTSRNREKERLYQEIEELKLGARRGDGSRSAAGDSIFERSISRAHGRSASRVSDVTKATQISDTERDMLEAKNGELRDQNAKLRLELQGMERAINSVLDELEGYDQLKIEIEKQAQTCDEHRQDTQAMQRERDEALKHQEDIELEMQDLKAEAQDRIDALEEELDQKDQVMRRLKAEISNQAEQSDALGSEVRSLNERILRVGEDMRSKIKKIEDLEIEIEAINRETEAIDKDFHEEKDKNARLLVQQESSQNEISFLREEQDEHVIKIGDLEDSINNLQNSLNSERERTKDLDSRLAEERHQREVIGSKEKQEVQKIVNDLNREASNAKEESRKLKKTLQSSEIDAAAVKERLAELEKNLREALGDSNGTRSSFLTVSNFLSLVETLLTRFSQSPSCKSSLNPH